jgi:hypothetical protein
MGANKYIKVSCSYCRRKWMKRSDSVRAWKGSCKWCAQRIATNLPEQKEKRSINAKVQVLRQGGIPNARKFTESMIGEKSPHWKGGVDLANRRARRWRRYHRWKGAILKRDTCCQLCGVDKNLHVHHIQKFATNPEKWFDLNNGITYCKTCHLYRVHHWKAVA